MTTTQKTASPPKAVSNQQSVETELDSLNQELRSTHNRSKNFRQRVEATIEAKAKKRRSNEVPASSKLK